MKILLANPSVAPHVKQSALAYEEAAMLDKFCTSFFRHKNKRNFPLPANLERELNRRSFDQLPLERFAGRPLPELLRIAASRFAGPLLTDRIWEWAETGFDAWVSGLIETRRPDAVHVYEHAALASLHAARQQGVLGIYEQTSAHHAAFSKILQAQLQKYPEIRTEALALKTDEKSLRRNARRDRELQLADVLICNSGFAARTLHSAGISMKNLLILPLGFPEVKTPAKSTSGPVVFLHAGNQSVTKASHIVYQAWRKCTFTETEAELWLIGNMALPEKCRAGLPGKVVISRNVPHSEMQKLYSRSNVLLAPSLADGFGMVITEAMANSIPAIASENCCGPDVITPGLNGWIVQPGNPEQLAQAMKNCVQNKHRLQDAGTAAQAKAAAWPWAAYRKELAKKINERWTSRNEKSA